MLVLLIAKHDKELSFTIATHFIIFTKYLYTVVNKMHNNNIRIQNYSIIYDIQNTRNIKLC